VQVGGRADLVRMEMRDEHARDAPSGSLELRPPELLRIGQAGPAVDDRPALLAGEEVGVHVPGTRRQRQRDLAHARGKEGHGRERYVLAESERVFYPAGGVKPEYRLEPCKSALNAVRGMPFKWSLNPYMGCAHRCTFCYVRQFENRADRPSDDRYGRSIRVKTNVAEVLAKELARRSWQREEIAVGTATDPYQPAEGRFRLTRACIVELTRASTPFAIVTRGPLVVRDLDVLQEASSLVEVNVSVSLPTLDERVWRTTEPGTAPPRGRLEAIRRLAGAGIDVTVGMAPILPGLSDDPRMLEEVVRAAKAAGARAVWANVLYLKPAVRAHFLAHLADDWPEHVERYEQLYATGAYLPTALAQPIRERVRAVARALPDVDKRRPRGARPAPKGAEQLALAV
jgi:DNA repair photolyase